MFHSLMKVMSNKVTKIDRDSSDDIPPLRLSLFTDRCPSPLSLALTNFFKK